MTPSLKAILARCGGDPIDAAVYCHDIMTQYPHLKAEYGAMLLEITTLQWGVERAEAACAQ